MITGSFRQYRRLVPVIMLGQRSRGAAATGRATRLGGEAGQVAGNGVTSRMSASPLRSRQWLLRGPSALLRYDLCVRQGDGTWPSLVKALVWGTREPGFKSRRPDR
jgi:hypothetical protein